MLTFLVLLALAAGSADAARVAAQPVTAASAIKLDGELSEEVWQKAPVVSGFKQREPKEGAPASYDTEARIAYDADAIYVAVQAIDPDPSRIVGIRTRRDESSPSTPLTPSRRASSASARAGTKGRRRTGFA